MLCKTLYNNYKQQYKQHQIKAGRLHVLVSLVVFSFVFVQYLALKSRVKGN